MKYKDEDAQRVALMVMETVNAYKRAVHLPETPIDIQSQRFKSVVAGVLELWDNPEVSPAENHDKWVERMKSDGWVYGYEVDEVTRTHPALLDYHDVPPFYKVNDLLFLNIVRSNFPNG